jgi:hypothetical protein
VQHVADAEVAPTRIRVLVNQHVGMRDILHVDVCRDSIWVLLLSLHVGGDNEGYTQGQSQLQHFSYCQGGDDHH